MSSPAASVAIVLPLVLAIAGPSFSAEGKIGDAAPPLEISKWIKGGPVDLAKAKGKEIVVVEFWATWCPPCRTSIPHLTELQKKYRDKGVVIVGVSGEDASKVEPFVKDMGEKMDYLVAIDDGGKTSQGYMKAFGQGGIPHAFIVDRDGRIIWHGHPMANLDAVLAKLTAGTYGLDEARAEETKARDSVRVIGSVREYFAMIRKLDDLGEKVLGDAQDQPELLNELAWTILTSKAIRTRDLDLALRAARRAHEAAGEKNAAIADTYARALFDTGSRAEAIELQKKAIEMCEDEEMLGEMKKVLEDYEARARVRVRL